MVPSFSLTVNPSSKKDRQIDKQSDRIRDRDREQKNENKLMQLRLWFRESFSKWENEDNGCLCLILKRLIIFLAQSRISCASDFLPSFLHHPFFFRLCLLPNPSVSAIVSLATVFCLFHCLSLSFLTVPFQSSISRVFSFLLSSILLLPLYLPQFVCLCHCLSRFWAIFCLFHCLSLSFLTVPFQSGISRVFSFLSSFIYSSSCVSALVCLSLSLSLSLDHFLSISLSFSVFPHCSFSVWHFLCIFLPSSSILLLPLSPPKSVCLCHCLSLYFFLSLSLSFPVLPHICPKPAWYFFSPSYDFASVSLNQSFSVFSCL